jgi:metallo-beta-lactamase class B
MPILRVLAILFTLAILQNEWTTPVQPFRVIDTIYYVGTQELASWLITTPEGHVLIDSGVEQNASHILSAIRKLKFQPRDVKVLLTTQAHFDHVAAFAALKKETGAAVIASAADAALLEGGGKGDYLLAASGRFPPVTVDRRVAEGEVLKIGGVELRAYLTPGHTQGTTTWAMTVKNQDGKPLQAVFVGSTHVNEGTRLIGNPVYPHIAEDFAGSIERLSKMKVDVFLGAHLSPLHGLDKSARLRGGARPNPFIDPAGFATYIDGSRKAFEKELAKQKR